MRENERGPGLTQSAHAVAEQDFASDGANSADNEAAARSSDAALSMRYGVQRSPQASAGTDSDRRKQVQLSRIALQRHAGADPDMSAEETGGASSDSVQAHAAAGVQGSAESMPFVAQIQPLFGRHDVSGVKAHTGEVAADACESIGAQAFASGEHVAFAGAPDLHTAAHEAAHVVQQRGGVQLKGGVGQQGDQFEQHADAVADRVASGRSAEALLDRFAGGARSSAVQARAVQRRGEVTVRRGSKGRTVKELQQRLNAKGAEPPLKIDGDFGPKTKAAVVSFQRAHKDSKGKQLSDDGIVGKLTWGSINDEHEKTEIKNEDAALGKHVADGMTQNNQGPHLADQGVHYDFNYKRNYPDKWNDDYSNGLADPQYFERIGWMDWRLKPNMSAAAGIKSWLRGLTIAECNSAIVAIQTDTVRAAIGDAKFDGHFGSTDKTVPESQRMRIKTGTSGTVIEGMNKDTAAAAKGEAGTIGNRPVEVGDWCYFYNHPQYLLKHPGGAFQGENSIYMGLDTTGKQRWSGMGVDNVTEKTMLLTMVRAYNQPRDDWDNKELARIKADNGGTLPAEYDMNSGVFPKTVSDPAAILAAPEYTIDGVKRKGGFIADAPSRLDTAKIRALT